MQNLRDKLLQAGLIDKKQKKQADHRLRQERTRARREGRPPDADAEIKAQIEREVEERRRKERQQKLAENERRRLEEEARRQQEERQARERRRRSEEEWQKLKARSLLEANMFLPQAPGPVHFYFLARRGGIRRLDLSTRLATELAAGLLAICQMPAWGEEKFGLVRKDVAEMLLKMDPSLVRFFVRDPERDLLELPPVVNDPPPKRLGPGKIWHFSPRPEGSGDRRE
jgi:uncharacterized protein YaiL (DUF2058 family)